MGKPRGLYTPIYASLPRHPKILQAADDLGITRHKLIGHLVCLWTWSLSALPSEGNSTISAPAISAKTVALAAEWPTRTAARFAAALADSGLLDRVGDGFIPHDWAEYGGKVVGEKQYDRNRKRPQVPGEFRGNSALDETRRDDTRSDLDGVGAGGQLEPLTLEQSALLLTLHRGVADRVFGGSGAPPNGWCEDLIRRGATASDVEAAVVAMRPNLGARAKGLPYGRAVIERRVQEREDGHDPDESAAGGANAARGQSHPRTVGARGMAGGGARRGTPAASEYAGDFTV